MLPDKLLGDHYRIIPKSLNQLLGFELYGQIVAETVNFQNKLKRIPPYPQNKNDYVISYILCHLFVWLA
jgi:hypothetical protein